jgi:F0F1-type ATP synthase membrane subunit b/b'
MPELIHYDLSQKGTKNEMDRTRFWKASGNAAVDMLLGPTPIPSAFKGAIEISLDRNFYTGGDITPDYLKKLEASRQYTASTSELGKIFSAATQIPFTAKEGKENKRVLSPIQADHLMRSLGGSVASVSMFFTNLVFNSDRPSTQLKENPLLGGLVGADVARRNESLFYDLKERSDKLREIFSVPLENKLLRDIADTNEKIESYERRIKLFEGLKTLKESRSQEAEFIKKSQIPAFKKRIAELKETAAMEALRLTETAKKQIEAERQAAIISLRAEVGALAIDLASSVIKQSLKDDKNASSMVDGFLADLEKDSKKN